MYLSYSGFKKDDECPRAYWHNYINKTKVSDNRIGSSMGSIIGGVFELFYSEKLWREKDPEAALQDRVKPVARKVVKKELTTGVFNWKDPRFKRNGPHSMAEVIENVVASVPNGLKIIKQHRLLGVGAQAEVKLDTGISGHIIGGRADFIMQRLAPHGDNIIVDGKGSIHRDKYVDARQLLWYAMLHRKKLGVLPDRLAFLYWKSEPSEAIDWVTPTKDDVDELQDRVIKSAELIELRTKGGERAFPTRPKPFNCKFCPYLSA